LGRVDELGESPLDEPSPDFADALDLHAFPELERAFKELLDVPGQVLVRDTRNRDEATLGFSAGAWQGFLTSLYR